jgi:alkylation response protein AidB-like acyl-CoA dehydrogenase
MRTPEQPGQEVWGGRRGTFYSDDARLWLERMVARGFTAPTWPRAYGGADLDAADAQVLAEELRAAGCRMALRSLGLWMLGPVLLAHGTEEQKRYHLPAIASGAHRWCQGYSEPAAGSDLASLTTRAVRDGDDYVVDGHKVWTSHADKADWMFCLVRTDPAAAKRDGISFLLIDMASPGVSVRPIELISGSSVFCETRFEAVRVPIGNRIGGENQGWRIAVELLQHERAVISVMRDAVPEESEPLAAMALRLLGARDGALADPLLRDRIARADIDFLCNRLTIRRVREDPASAAVGMIGKLVGTELSQRRKELRVELAGYQALGWAGDGYTADELQLTRDWLRSRASTIEGGTSEIQLNTIAKRILGLPD